MELKTSDHKVPGVRTSVIELMDEMTPAYLVRTGGVSELIKLAELLHCQTHKYQATERAGIWFLKAQDAAHKFLMRKEIRAENISLHKKQTKLAETVALAEQDLAKESEKASLAMTKIRIWQNLAIIPAGQLADHRKESAALVEQFDLVRNNLPELKKINEVLSHALAKMEEARESETEPFGDSFEVEPRPQEAQEAHEVQQAQEAQEVQKPQEAHEWKAYPSKKLSRAQRRALRNQAKLANLSLTEQNDPNTIAELSTKLIEAEQKAQEAQRKEAQLSGKYFHTERQARIREAAMSEKLQDSAIALSQSQESCRVLQLKLEKLSQSMTTKDEVYRINLRAQWSTIFLLQSELRSQQSQLKENHIWDNKKGQTQKQETSFGDNGNDCTSVILRSTKLDRKAAQAKVQEMAPLTRFEALDSLATYLSSST